MEGLVYGDFSFARPSAKKPTFLRLRGLFEDEIASCNHSISPFFSTPGFVSKSGNCDRPFIHNISSYSLGAIREQLADLDLRIILL